MTTFQLNTLPELAAGHLFTAHDTSLRTALNVGRNMNIPLPDDDNVQFIAIEAENVYNFSEELSPLIAAAVPQAADIVIKLIA